MDEVTASAKDSEPYCRTSIALVDGSKFEGLEQTLYGIVSAEPEATPAAPDAPLPWIR